MTASAINARRVIAGAYVLVALVVTWQRGVASRDHTTFAIFRQSTVHLVQHRDLYARYPDEQGAEPRDRFKYSPSAAALFAPLSAIPYPLALLAWNLLNTGLLFYAVTRLLSGRQADVALLSLLPEVLASVQSESSNGLVAGLMLLALDWILRGRHAKAAFAIGIGAAIKVFPIAVAAVALTRREWRRLALAMSGVALLLFALPLVVVSLPELHTQYLSWHALELSDARDTAFGMSLIRAIRHVWPTVLPNWTFQLGGGALLFAPLLRRERWSDPAFGLRFGCSILVFAVLFNHQAERASLVIATAGVAVWLATRDVSLPLLATFAIALTGESIIPYAALWIALQCELLGDMPSRPADAPLRAGMVSLRGASCRACGNMVLRARIACAHCRAIAPAWCVRGAPDVVASTMLVAAFADTVTPQHMLFSWNLWDLVR